MATTYNDFLPDLGQLQTGDVILYGNKLNPQSQAVQALFSQNAAMPFKANGIDTIGITVNKPYRKSTTNYDADGNQIYPTVDLYNNPLTGNQQIDQRNELLRTQQSALEKNYLGMTGDISNQYGALRQTVRDAGNRNMGVLNRILGRAGGFTTTAGGTALVAKQGELDSQINQLNIAQQEALNKAKAAYMTGQSDLLSKANSDIATIRQSILDAQNESAKNMAEMQLKMQESDQNYDIQQQKLALEQAKFEFEKANPNIKADIATMTIDGKPHNVLINMATGETIKDLGEVIKTTGSGSSTNDISTNDRAAIQSDIEAITGSDGFLDTAKYQKIRQNIAVNSPKLLSWFDSTYDPKMVLNPKDATAQKFFKTGTQLTAKSDEEKLIENKDNGYTREQAIKDGWAENLIIKVYGEDDRSWWEKLWD